MAIWSAEIKELERLYGTFKGQFPDLEKELERLIKADDENMILLYSRRCLEVVITDLCECELKRPRKTEPLKGIIDKLHKEGKVPSNIITSMDHLNSLSAYGAHPKDFDPEQVKPVLVNLDVIIKWYLKYKEPGTDIKAKPDEEIRLEIKSTGDVKKDIAISRKRFAGILGGLIAIIASVFAVLYFSNIIGGSKQSNEVEKSIAVLPFRNDSPEDSTQYFMDGVMEELLNRLQSLKSLRVIGRTSVEQFRGQDKSISEIAKELGVNYIVEGSGQKSGNSLRMRVQLIITKNERHIWGNSFEQVTLDMKEYFKAQSSFAEAIANELMAVITPQEKQLIEKVPTSNILAYNLYLKANNYLREYVKNRDLSSYNSAVNLYKETLEMDSAYARAYTGLAWAYFDRYQWETYFKENYLDSMKVLADKALSLDNQLDEAYYLKGFYFRLIGDRNRSLANYDKAIEFNPNYYQAYQSKGTVTFDYIGDYVGGLIYYLKALALMSGNDRPSGLRALGYRYMGIGFVNEAKFYYQEAFSLDSDRISYLNGLMWIEFSQGNFEKALSNQKQKYEIDSTILPYIELMFYNITPGHKEEAYLMAKKKIDFNRKSGRLGLQEAFQIGYALSQVGQDQEANKYFKEQIRYDEESIRLNRYISQLGYAQYDLASTYAFLGDKAKAYNYLEEFVNNNFQISWQISYAKHNYFMNSISNEERYQKILQNMEAKYQAEHERVRKWLEEQGMLKKNN